MIGIGIGIAADFLKITSQQNDGVDTDYLKKNSLFLGGELDFENNKWKDDSINQNDADIVEGSCLVVNNDVTLVLDVKRIGATVTMVNDSEILTTGVSVNGSGDIAIDQSELIVNDSKIWNIFLSTGEEFRLTTGNGAFIFTSGNFGILSGTIGTEWEWGSTDEAHLNLRYGFSKYPCVKGRYALSNDDRTFAVRRYCKIEYEWEGWLHGVSGVLFAVSTLYGESATPMTYKLSVHINRSTGVISVISRDIAIQFYINVGSTNLDRQIKIKIEYNGNGITDKNNYEVYYNDTLLTGEKSDSSLTIDRTMASWGGNNQDEVDIIVRNFYFRYGEQQVYFIKNGLYFYGECVNKLNTASTYFIRVPVFNNTDALGFTPTNPALTGHNRAESKIKMREIENLISADVNNFMFTAGAANRIDMNQMYSEIGNKIFCDNSDLVSIKNLTVLSDSFENAKIPALAELFNGYRETPLYCGMRVDVDGEDDGDVPMLQTLLQETGGKVTAHTTHNFNATPTGWEALIDNKIMALAIHAFAPAFWKYGTYEEGVIAYNNSTQGEKDNYTVVEDMGIISCVVSPYPTSKQCIESLHARTGLPYPDDVPPRNEDNNNMWWEWVFDAFNALFQLYGGEVDSFSELGALPSGISNQMHPDVNKLIYSRLSYPFGEDYEYEDNLSDDISIFDSSGNASIELIDGEKVQKLTGTGGEAWGNINIGSTIGYTRMIIDLKAKSVNGSKYPFDKMFFCNKYSFPQIVFGDNILINGVDFGANPCVANEWYRIVIDVNRNQIFTLFIYDDEGDCVFISKTSGSENALDHILIYNSDCDSVFKNVKIFVSRKISDPLNDTNISWESYSSGDNYEDHLNKVKARFLHAIWNGGLIPQLFGHRVKNPEIKEPDGTAAGMHDRSYLGFKNIHEWINANGGEWINSYDYGRLPDTPGRYNLIRNGDFSDDLWGMSGEIWGYANREAEAGEILKVGVNVLKIPNGENIINRQIIYSKPGIKILRFWLKGKVRITGAFFNEFTSIFDTSGEWQFFEIPFFVKANFRGPDTIGIIALADSYLQKIELDDL